MTDSEFNRLALELFALQFEHNEPYRRLCDARDASPETIRDWTDIPAMPTSAFKEWDVTSLPPNRRDVVFHSSGTTKQTPGRHYHDAESIALYEYSIKPWFARNLLSDSAPGGGTTNEPPHRFGLLTPPPNQAPNSSLAHMLKTVCAAFGSPNSRWLGTVDAAGAWAINTDHAVQLLDEATASDRPLILLGTAFSFVHLIDHLADTDCHYDLPAGSRVMETGGYKGRSRELPQNELHRLISQRLGVPPDRIIREYGMSELSSQAYDQAPQSAKSDDSKLSTQTNSQPFRFPPWARARIVSPETGLEVAEGETGLIRVVDLANVRSVAAIQTEDLGVRRGDGFELLGRAALAEPRGCSRMSD